MRGDDALPWILPQAHPFPQRIGDAAAAGAHAIMTKFFPRRAVDVAAGLVPSFTTSWLLPRTRGCRQR